MENYLCPSRPKFRHTQQWRKYTKNYIDRVKKQYKKTKIPEEERKDVVIYGIAESVE
jgi:hypothetical protein